MKWKTAQLNEKIVSLERISTNNGQYLRNKQIEIRRMPKDDVKLSPKHLKVKVSNFLALTNVKVSAADIGKCHPLGKSGSTVLLEFKDREMRDAVLHGRSQFKNNRRSLEAMSYDKAMVLESMTREYSKLDFICRKLKHNGHIIDTWFF